MEVLVFLSRMLACGGDLCEEVVCGDNEACDPGTNAYNDATNNQAFLAGQISMKLFEK